MKWQVNLCFIPSSPLSNLFSMLFPFCVSIYPNTVHATWLVFKILRWHIMLYRYTKWIQKFIELWLTSEKADNKIYYDSRILTSWINFFLSYASVKIRIYIRHTYLFWTWPVHLFITFGGCSLHSGFSFLKNYKWNFLPFSF